VSVAAVRRRLDDLSLRTRLVLVTGVAVAIAAALVAGIAWVAVRHELFSRVDTQLHQQVRDLQRQFAFSAGSGLPVVQLRSRVGETGGYVQVVAADGRTAPAENQGVALPVSQGDIRVAAGSAQPHIRDVHVASHDVRMITSPLGNGLAVQVALPIDSAQEQLHRLALIFGLVALGAVAGAVALSRFASSTALVPVARLTEAAEGVAATRDLNVRIDAPGRDELGRLAFSFNTMLDALQRSEASQRQLVTDASHELRTPLTSIRTNVEVMRRLDELPPEERRAVIDAVVGQLDELTGLVADVVDLARGDEPPESFEDLRLDEVTAEAVARARRNWPRTTFELSAAPVTVRGVERRLSRAVANLLDNAAKFSGAEGHVDVRLDPDGVLAVTDDGPGVPAESLPHVFDRFFRAPEARALPGSGLGLSIVRQVAELHGGHVSLDNAPGGGARARLFLPQRAG
jgi:two-component system sensor histidine kinase MprB